jgi:hypothetical protein
MPVTLPGSPTPTQLDLRCLLCLDPYDELCPRIPYGNLDLPFCCECYGKLSYIFVMLHCDGFDIGLMSEAFMGRGRP